MIRLSYFNYLAYGVIALLLSQPNYLSATNCNCPNNLVSNPSFENGTTGWIKYNGDLSADTYAAQCGSKAGHFKHTSGTGGFYQIIPGLTVGTSLNLSFYAGVHNNSFNQRFGLRYFNSSNTLISEDVVDVNGPLPDMEFYTIYSTIPPGTVTVQVEGRTNGDWLKVDMICLSISSICNPDNANAPPFCAPTPICEVGNFIWSQPINMTNGNATVRLVCGSVSSFTIPGPYPPSFSAATTIQISDVVSYDGYSGRSTVTQQNERWRLVFRKNGSTVATSNYTQDVPDQKNQAYWRGGLGSVTLPNGTDEIKIELWSVANDANCNNGPNSVVPVSVCLKSSPICENFGSAILSDVNLVKSRTAQNQITCGSEPDRAVYFSCLLDNISGGTSGNRKLWKIVSGGTFKEYCNGTAFAEFTIQNVELSTYKFKVNLIFSGRTYSAPAGNPHIEGCTSSATSNWYYYPKLNGEMIGQETLNGAVLSLKLTMAAFQLGTNASLYGVLGNFGASAWLDYSILMHPTSFQLKSGCQADFNFFLTGGNLISSDANNCGEICKGSSASLKAVAAGGKPPYSFSWSSGLGTGDTKTVNPTVNSSYTITATDFNGCTSTSQISIKVLDGPSVNAGADQSGCPGGSFNLSASATGGTSPYTYSWSDGLGNGQNKTVNPASTTTYTVTVTDAKGCIATDQVKVTVHPAPSVTATKIDAICGQNNGSATANGSGGTSPYTYLWSNSGTTQTISGLSAGNYSVTLTDAKGCKANTSITLVSTAGPTVNAGTDQSGCPGSSFNLTATASNGKSPYIFTWNQGLGNGPSKTVSPSSTTTYSVTVTDVNGCTATDEVKITIHPSPLVVIAKGDAKCGQNNGSATANASGGTSPYTYLWSNGASSMAITGLSAGSYSVTITDSKGCKANASTLINQQNGPTVSAGTDIEGCVGSTFQINATAIGGTTPYTYNWNNGLGAGQSKNVSPSGTTTYIVTVTDANGCSATDNVKITIYPNPQVTISKSDANCGQINGSATANPTGGTPPYTFLWSNGAMTPSISGLSASTYSVTITDSKGCKSNASTNINSTGGPTVNAGPDQIGCQGSSFNLSASATSGSTPYVFSWNQGLGNGPNKTVSPSSTTIYTVSVIDVNGCLATDQIEVVIKPRPSVNAGADVNICAGTLTVLTANGSGGQAPYTYNWSNGLGTGQSKSVAPVITTTYTVTVTDANFCTNTSTVKVNVTGPCACVSDMTFNVGSCDPSNNFYAISGQVSFVNPPITGVLTVSSSSGAVQVFNAPFVSPINFQLTGLNSIGANRSISAVFSDNANCTITKNYTEPPSCLCVIENLTAVPGPCDPLTNLFNLVGQVYFINPPTTGTLVVTIPGLGTQTFFPPFGSPIGYSINGLNSDGATKTIQAYFTTYPNCSYSKNFAAPVQCKSGPNITHNKELVNIVQIGPRTYNVNYKIDVRNIGGSTGQYSLSDQPNFDDDIQILSSSYTTLNVPGLPFGNLAGTGPWTLATARSLAAGFVHTYNISIQVQIDLNPGSSGNNVYTYCGQFSPGNPRIGEGLYNESFLDKNADGTIDEIRKACGDIPYIIHQKTISSVTQTGPRSFRVIYQIKVENIGGTVGIYGLKDQPNFDNDISIISSSFVSNAPGIPGSALVGTGPWTLANNQSLAANGSHSYTITVNTMIDLSTGSGGDNVYRNCGYELPGIPNPGEGLFNQSLLDINNDGQPDEIKHACGDIPYITHLKTFSSVTQTGVGTYKVVYKIDVTNKGGLTGQYGLVDAPGFDNDIVINNASYTSTALGVPGGALIGSGPWTLSVNQSLAPNQSHSYFITVNVTLDLSAASPGDRSYKKCGQTLPGSIKPGEGLFNQSRLDVNNDQIQDETSDVCGDIPNVTHQKTILSILPIGVHTYQVKYNIAVRNLGGSAGSYSLVDAPAFDDDIAINSASFTTDAPGIPGGGLFGLGPWTLATNWSIAAGAVHNYTITVNVAIDLKTGSNGDNVYRKCGFSTPGTPREREGLFNRSLLDTNGDGTPEEISEVCGDIPYITHQKTVQNIIQTGSNTFRINYNIVVKNIGGVSGNYGLKDQPAFDNDLVINSASYTSSAPGFPGSALAGTGPWTLATNQALAAGGQHTFTVTVNVTLDLSPASAGDKVYKRCGYGTPGIPTSGEGLFNRSLLDVNNDGTADEISTACEDIPQLTHRKEINSIVNTGLNSYRVTYKIIVENKGGVNGKYTLTDRPIFDDDIAITSTNYSSDVPGIPGSALIGTGPWTLATNQSINGGATHTFTLVVNVNLDLKPGSGGNNVYTRCGQAQQGIPAAGEGLFNRSLLDVNEDGIPDEIREVCGDIPYITHLKTVQSVTQTGLNTYRVNYNIEVRNSGGTVGNYGLSDAPSFDDDITINNANFTSTAPGNPGSALAGNGPWQLANNLSINAGALHVYTLTVNVTLDLRPVTGGDNVYRKCGQITPGVPKQGEGLFNRSLLDTNNDGTPDEISEVCEDIPYITHQKTVQTVTQTGTNTFSVSYQIVVRNTGGVQGRYGLNDQPAFDNDILINSASFTSNAPGIPGSALAGLGPWVLATNHPIAAGAQHTYIVTVNVTLDLSPASAGDKVYRRCGQGTPGVPTLGEGLFNRSLLDVNNDGNPDEISTACEDLPQLTHRKEISSITNTGLNTYRVTYRIIVENKGGVTGKYTLTDRPSFDDDIAITTANYSSDFVGGPGGPLFGTGPWTLATLQNIGANTTHIFTLVVNVNLDLRLSSGGNNIYSKCGQSRQGIPSEGEGLFNRSLLDVNADGIPDEIREVCGDIPAIEHEKRFLNSVRQPNGSYNVSYVIDVCNKGGAVGTYTLRDKPAFDDDININSTRFQKNFAGPFTVLSNPVPGSGWLLANLTNLAAGACDQFVIEFNVSIDLSPASGGDNIYKNCGSSSPTPRSGEGLFNESLLDLTNDGVPDQRDTVCRDIPFIVHQKNFISAELQPNQTYLVTYQIEVCNSGGASGLYDLYDKPEMDDDVNILSASYQSTVHGNTNLSTPVPFNGWLIGNDINLGANTCHTYTLRFNLSIDLNPGTPGDNIYKKCGESIPGIPKSGEGLFNLSLLDLDNDGVPEQKDTACTDIITGLGDCVWNDLNYNGLQDPGEPGVKGVKASLYRCDGTFITSTTTNDMGKYFFIGIAGNQSYYVKFDKATLPPAFEFTKSNVGINDALDSDPDATGSGPCLYVPTGKIDSTYDAGLVKLATIGNFVWVDKNGNGFQEFDEEGVHNVTVKLIDAITKTVVKTEITDITGYYLIRSVRPGSYYLQFEWPDSLISTKPKAGNDVLDSDVNDANGIRTTAVTDLTAGEVDLTWDLGLVVCSSIGGRVFLDANSDGIFNQNENGINGLRVFLVDATSHKVIRTFITKVDPTTPSNDGWYNFTCLPPGSYYIQYERIPELVATPPYVGTNPAKYSYITHELGINTTRIFVTISGSLFQNVNGGFQIRSSLGDFVWFDGNYNGLQDPGELPLPDVQVMAYSRDGKLVGEAISGDNGYFDLDVPAGDVYLKVNTKQQFAFTIPHSGDDEFNSDVDGTNGYGTTRTYRVQSSSALPNVDVGLIYGVLPVEWVEVEANRKGESNEILWTTGAELYCKRFEIERRFENESSFKQIGIQSARGSAQGKLTDYFMYDFDILHDGIYYYRIKQVDETGAYTYSKVVSVLVNRNQTNFLSVYPIPAQELLNVDFWLYQDGESTIKIVDQTGKVILNSGEPVFRTKGKHQEKMDIAHFPPGNYVIQVMTNFGVLQQKFTKTH